MTRTEAYLILNALRLVGPVRVRKLREMFGGVEGIVGMASSKLAGVEGVGQAVAMLTERSAKVPLPAPVNWTLAGSTR